MGGDEAFVIPTIAWFPSHTGELDLASAHALRAYDAVAATSLLAHRKTAKDRKVIPDPIDDRKFQE